MENNFIISANDPESLAKTAVEILIEKKGIDVSLYDVSCESPLTDYYINVTGRSFIHVSSLADNVACELVKHGIKYPKFEGKRGDGWILLDFGDVIINIFDRPSRQFYDLDRLFDKEKLVDISDIIKKIDNKFTINKI